MLKAYCLPFAVWSGPADPVVTNTTNITVTHSSKSLLFATYHFCCGLLRSLLYAVTKLRLGSKLMMHAFSATLSLLQRKKD